VPVCTDNQSVQKTGQDLTVSSMLSPRPIWVDD
jgi:hypothetical protein